MEITVTSMLSIVLLIGAILSIIGCITAFLYNVRLSLYLRKKYSLRWEQLTTIGSIGPGLSNPIRWIVYLFNRTDQEDIVIQKFKKRIRLCIAFVACALFCFLGIFSLLAI